MSSGSRGNFTAPGIKPDPFPSLAVYTAPETEANEQINNKSPESGARRGFSASPDPLHAPGCHLAPSCAPWLLLHPKSPWQGRRGRGTGMGTPSPGPGLTLLARTAATPRPVTSGYGDGPFFFFFFYMVFIFPAACQEAVALPQPKAPAAAVGTGALCSATTATKPPETGGFGPKTVPLAGGGCRIDGWFCGSPKTGSRIPSYGAGTVPGQTHPAAFRLPGHRCRYRPGVSSLRSAVPEWTAAAAPAPVPASPQPAAREAGAVPTHARPLLPVPVTVTGLTHARSVLGGSCPVGTSRYRHQSHTGPLRVQPGVDSPVPASAAPVTAGSYRVGTSRYRHQPPPVRGDPHRLGTSRYRQQAVADRHLPVPRAGTPVLGAS